MAEFYIDLLIEERDRLPVADQAKADKRIQYVREEIEKMLKVETWRDRPPML
jgi:hypothetical protein